MTPQPTPPVPPYPSGAAFKIKFLKQWAEASLAREDNFPNFADIRHITFEILKADKPLTIDDFVVCGVLADGTYQNFQMDFQEELDVDSYFITASMFLPPDLTPDWSRITLKSRISAVEINTSKFSAASDDSQLGMLPTPTDFKNVEITKL